MPPSPRPPPPRPPNPPPDAYTYIPSPSVQFTLAVSGPAGTIDSPVLLGASDKSFYHTEEAYRSYVLDAIQSGLGIPQTAVAAPLPWSRTRYRTRVTVGVGFASDGEAALAIFSGDQFWPLGPALVAALLSACPYLAGSGLEARLQDFVRLTHWLWFLHVP